MTRIPTAAEIHDMTPEELAALNKKLARKLGKKILTKIVVGSAVAVGVHLLVKHLDSQNEIDIIETPSI